MKTNGILAALVFAFSVSASAAAQAAFFELTPKLSCSSVVTKSKGLGISKQTVAKETALGAMLSTVPDSAKSFALAVDPESGDLSVVRRCDLATVHFAATSAGQISNEEDSSNYFAAYTVTIDMSEPINAGTLACAFHGKGTNDAAETVSGGCQGSLNIGPNACVLQAKGGKRLVATGPCP